MIGLVLIPLGAWIERRRHARQQRPHLFGDPFGAGAACLPHRVAALVAAVGNGDLVAALVAVQAASGLATAKTYAEITKGGTVRDANKTVTIAVSHVEYESPLRHYAHVGVRIDADELLVTNGCSEALHLAVRAVAQPGDTIAVESPTYFGFLQNAESLGVKIVEIPVHPREGLSIGHLRKLLASRAGRDIRACVTIPNFSNPTGASLSPRRKRELVALCRDADVALIEDDIYGELQHQGPRPLPCKTFDRDGRVMLCSSFSTSLAPGKGLRPPAYQETR